MRIVHTADWHIGKILNDYSLLEDQRSWFFRFADRLSELRADALIVAGDLYDRSVPSAEAVTLLGQILCDIVLERGIPTLLVAGNHDSRERLSFGSELLERSGLHIAGRIERQIRNVTLQKGGESVTFWLMPYFEPHNIKALYPDETIRTQSEAAKLYTAPMLEELDPSAVNILIGHGLFACIGADSQNDASAGGSEIADASPFEVFDYVALGHLHSHRTAGSERMIYAGSPLKYSIDEAGQDKSFTVLDIHDKDQISLHIESLPPLRDVRVLRGAFEELAELGRQNPTEDYIFAELTDETVILNAVSRLKSVYPNITGLKYSNLRSVKADKLVKSQSAIASLSEPELFSDFYQSVMEEPLAEEETEYVGRIFHELKGEANDTAQIDH